MDIEVRRRTTEADQGTVWLTAVTVSVRVLQRRHELSVSRSATASVRLNGDSSSTRTLLYVKETHAVLTGTIYTCRAQQRTLKLTLKYTVITAPSPSLVSYVCDLYHTVH